MKDQYHRKGLGKSYRTAWLPGAPPAVRLSAAPQPDPPGLPSSLHKMPAGGLRLSFSPVLSFGLVLIFLCVFLFAVAPMPVAAQQPTPSDNDVNRLAKEMYCPVCENIPLDVCPTQACAQWRALIRQKLAEGLSDAEIREYFVLQYGDRVLAEPPRQGLNWLVYILPPAFFIGGAAVLYRVLRIMRKPVSRVIPVVEEKSEPMPKDPYQARLEEELKRRQDRGL